MAALAEKSPCSAHIPFIRAIEHLDQLVIRQLLKINVSSRLESMRRDAIDTAVRAVPIGVRIGMCGTPIAPVCNIDSAIGSLRDVARCKPSVVAKRKFAAIGHVKRGTLGA